MAGALPREAGPVVTWEGASQALSERETQCLRLVALGQFAETIAPALGIKRSTVYFHMRGITRKLGAKSLSNAVYIAMRLGIVE